MIDKRYRWKIITVLVLIVATLVALGYLILSQNVKEPALPEPTPTPTVVASAEATATPMPTPTPEPTPTPILVDLDSDSSLNRIVNAAYPIRSDYVPDDLVEPNVTKAVGQKLRKEAAEQIEQLFEAAEEENIYLKLVSGYRDYSLQSSLYNTYVNRYGAAYADRIDDHPGASEHQLGLAADLGWYNGQCEIQACFADYPQYSWLVENAWKYGWILRYPEGKQEITRIIYSPWHFRYVGVEEAEKITASNLTMEEYYERSAG